MVKASRRWELFLSVSELRKLVFQTLVRCRLCVFWTRAVSSHSASPTPHETIGRFPSKLTYPLDYRRRDDRLLVQALRPRRYPWFLEELHSQNGNAISRFETSNRAFA